MVIIWLIVMGVIFCAGVAENEAKIARYYAGQPRQRMPVHPVCDAKTTDVEELRSRQAFFQALDARLATLRSLRDALVRRA